MVHSEVVTDNVEMVLLGFIAQTNCNLCWRMTPRSSAPSSCFPLRLRWYLPAQMSLLAQEKEGDGIFIFS